jgi:serine/threonine-protein kinase RsbW
MNEPQTLTVTAALKNLAQIGDYVLDVARQAGLSDKAGYAVQMAVDEACANIIEHAYGSEGKGDIRIDCISQEAGLEVIIIDQGRPFEPDQIPRLDPATPLEERTRRGMGLFFIYKLMDRVEYRFNTPQGNKLILFKSK